MSEKNVGLYRKFEVVRTDGQSEPGKKHEGCRYFVLDLDHDRHAIPALRMYAVDCALDYPKLSEDLLKIAAEMETRLVPDKQ